jgi:hypothetical protein
MADNTTTQKMWQSAVSSTANCLPLEVLEKMTEASAVDQKAADQKAAAHLSDCPNCQTELSLLKNFEASVPSADEGAAVAWIAAQLQRKQNTQVVKSAVARVSIWRAMFRVPYLAGAAALAVVLALAVSLHHSGNQEHPTKIGGGGSYGVSGFRAGAIHLKSPVGNLTQAPVEFRWEAFPGASSYSIELRDAIGTVLATKTTKQNVIVVTPEMKANMSSGKPLKWKITALDAAGNEIANSTGGDFKIN